MTTQGDCNKKDEAYILLNKLNENVIDLFLAGHRHDIVHNWINNNVEYSSGGFINYSSLEQNVNVSFTDWIINPGYRRGDLNIYVTDSVPGQTVQVDFVRSSSGTISTVYLTTDTNGFCRLTDIFYKNYTATITVQPINKDGIEYLGTSTTYEL